MLFAFSASAAWMRIGPFTNGVTGLADTNVLKIIPVSGPVANADGSFTTIGLPLRVTPSTDGSSTNLLSENNYVVSNSFLGQGIVFRAPNDAGPTVYSMYAYRISGFNTFVTLQLNGGTNGPVTLNQVTNALGFLPPTTGQALNQVSNAIPTNFWSANAVLWISNLVTIAHLNTNSYAPGTLLTATTNAAGLVTFNAVNQTNGMTSIVFSNAAMFYPANNPSNFLTSLSVSGFQPADPNLTNFAKLATNSYVPATTLATLQPGSANLTNFAGLATNSFYPRSNPSNFLTTASIGGPFQPADANLTNFALLATNSFYPTSNPSNFITKAETTNLVVSSTNGLASTNYVNAATNNLLATITNIAQQYSSTASNAIASANGLGTNTTIVTGKSITTTNLYAGQFVITNNAIGPTNYAGINLSQGGVAVFQIGAQANTNGHFIIGVASNTIGSGGFGDTPDTGNRDRGVGIVGGDWNLINDQASASMFYEYIVGGWSNTINVKSSLNFNGASNNIIVGSVNSSILNPNVANASVNNMVIGSRNSGINATNVVSGTVKNNMVINGDNALILPSTTGATMQNSTAVGANVTVTHPRTMVYSDGTTVQSYTNSQVVFMATNGFGINTNNAGTNGLRVAGNIDSSVGFSVLGVPITASGITAATATNIASAQAQLATNNLMPLVTNIANAAAQLATNGMTSIVYADTNRFAPTNVPTLWGPTIHGTLTLDGGAGVTLNSTTAFNYGNGKFEYLSVPWFEVNRNYIKYYDSVAGNRGFQAFTNEVTIFDGNNFVQFKNRANTMNLAVKDGNGSNNLSGAGLFVNAITGAATNQFATKPDVTNLVVTATNNLLPTVTNAIENHIFTQVVLTNSITTNGMTVSLQTGSGDMLFTRKGSAGSDLIINSNGITSGSIVGQTVTGGKILSTNVFSMGTLTNLQRTTNAVGVVGAGSAAANGTFQWVSGFSLYSNAWTTATINYQNPTWFITTNGVNLYSGPSANGPWSIVNGSSPAPTGDFGFYYRRDGIIDTNLTTQITNAIATSGFGVATKAATNNPSIWNGTNHGRFYADAATIDSGNSSTNTYGGKVVIFGKTGSGGDGGGSSVVSGVGNFSWGPGNIVTGQVSYALGAGNISSGANSVALGFQNISSGSASFANGDINTASGNFSTAFGNLNVATGAWALAMGHQNHASDYAVALMQNSYATNSSSFVVNDNSLGNLSSSTNNELTLHFMNGYRMLGSNGMIVGEKSFGMTNVVMSGWDNEAAFKANGTYSLCRTDLVNQCWFYTNNPITTNGLFFYYTSDPENGITRWVLQPTNQVGTFGAPYFTISGSPSDPLLSLIDAQSWQDDSETYIDDTTLTSSALPYSIIGIRISPTNIVGNGNGITNINISTATGTIPLGVLPAAVVTNGQPTAVTLAGGLTNSGALVLPNATLSQIAGPMLTTNGAGGVVASYNGAALTNLNVSATALPSYAITNNQGSPFTNLSTLTQVGNAVLGGVVTVSNLISATNAAPFLARSNVTMVESYNAAAFTNMNVATATGTLPLGTLPAVAITNNGTQVITESGGVTFNGGLTNTSAASFSSVVYIPFGGTNIITGGTILLTNAGTTRQERIFGDAFGGLELFGDQSIGVYLGHGSTIDVQIVNGGPGGIMTPQSNLKTDIGSTSLRFANSYVSNGWFTSITSSNGYVYPPKATGPTWAQISSSNTIVEWSSNSIPPAMWSSYFNELSNRVDKQIYTFP